MTAPVSLSITFNPISAKITTETVTTFLARKKDTAIRKVFSAEGATKMGKKKATKSIAATTESALQREQRWAVLEQLRGMVGGAEGCSQFEIVQLVILYIGHLSSQLLSAHSSDSSSSSAGDQVNSNQQQEQLSAALGQLIASLSLIRPNKKAQKGLPKKLQKAQERMR